MDPNNLEMDWSGSEASSIDDSKHSDDDNSSPKKKWTSPLLSSSPTIQEKGKQVSDGFTTFKEVLQVFTHLDDGFDMDYFLEEARDIAVTSYPCASQAVNENDDAQYVALTVTRAVRSFLSQMSASNKKELEAFLVRQDCTQAELEEDMLSFEPIFEKLWFHFWSAGSSQCGSASACCFS